MLRRKIKGDQGCFQDIRVSARHCRPEQAEDPLCFAGRTEMRVRNCANGGGISDKLASHHLKQLKKAGILTEKREGNFIRYGLDRKAIREHKSIFNKIIK